MCDKLYLYVVLYPVTAEPRSQTPPQTRRRAEGVGELSREAKIAAKRRPALDLRRLNPRLENPRAQKTEDPEVLRNAGSKVVAVCGAATS